MEQYETNLELNSNMSRSIIGDSVVVFSGDIEQLTIGENTTPTSVQYVDIDSYFYDSQHTYTIRVKIRYQYSEDLGTSSIIDYNVYIIGQSPMPIFTLDYCQIPHSSGARRFNVRVQGKLDLSPLTGDGVGDIVTVGGTTTVTL